MICVCVFIVHALRRRRTTTTTRTNIEHANIYAREREKRERERTHWDKPTCDEQKHVGENSNRLLGKYQHRIGSRSARCLEPEQFAEEKEEVSNTYL